MKLSINAATRRALVSFAVCLGTALASSLNAEESKPLATLKVTVNYGGVGAPLSVALSGDGKLLASASGEKTVVLWDTTTGKEKVRLEGHADAVSSVAFSGDGTLLASGSHDETVKLWDTVSGKEKATLKQERATREGRRGVFSVALSGAGKLVAAGTSGEVTLWDTTTGNVNATLKGQPNYVVCVAFSPDNKLLAHANYKTKPVQLWDVTTGTTKSNEEKKGTIEGDNAHDAMVNSVAFSGDGKLLASGGYDKKVRLWDVATGKHKATLEGHGGTIGSVAFSRDGKLLASGGHDETVRLWDVVTSKEKAKFDHPGNVWSVTFSGDGKLLASGSEDGTIKLWAVPGAK